jgi:3-hydroxybutyryl-CoA dehydrogenase
MPQLKPESRKELRMAVERVGVVGCGLMGRGIAQVCAQSGHPTVVSEISDELLASGMSSIEGFLRKGVEKGRVSEVEMQATLGNLTGTTDLGDFATCDLVIEAATENRDMKLEIFRNLDEICPPEAIFASNTSSLNITEMAVVTGRPDRVVGLHFFNPVPLMKLVEVIRTMLVDEAVVGDVGTFGEGLGKVVVVAKDRTGFIVNRLLVPYLLAAVRVLDEGLASMEDIDQAMKLGCGYPMGPFALLDLVGIDTTYYIANIMYEEFREPQFAPPPLLRRMVLSGRHGRKTGRGFYDYSA